MRFIAFLRDGKAEFAAAEDSQFSQMMSTLPDPKVVLQQDEFEALHSWRSVYTIVDGNLVIDQTEFNERQRHEAKMTAKHWLRETDFAALPDVTLVNKEQFTTFRAAVRQIYLTGVLPEGGMPTMPTPVWE
jgi:hypothetical protein